MQQREQMMTEIRKESVQLIKEFEKKNLELVTTLKSEILVYLTTNLETMWAKITCLESVRTSSCA